MASSPNDTLVVETTDAICRITLNRPKSLNAINPDMARALKQVAAEIKADKAVRVAVIQGAGDHFMAGGDVKGFKALLDENPDEGAIRAHFDEMLTIVHGFIADFRQMPKPVLGSVQGAVAGAGFSLMLACDLRIASNGARFLMAYGNIGATADGGSTYLLPRIVGAAKAMELYLASQPMSAESALEMGLVGQVCDKEALAQHALETAMRLAQGPTVAYGKVKELFLSSWGSTVEDHLKAETQAFVDISLTRDLQEGVKAFTEKRQPWFQGL